MLGAIGDEMGYDDLLPRSSELLIDKDVAIRILNLETLIEIKEQLGGEKDLAVLPILHQLLKEKK